MESETTEAIIRATGRSLCEYGYADLTMQRIAEASSVTTAAIHCHFDTKEELLDAFLDDLVDRFERQVDCEADDPRERLAGFLDAVFGSEPDDEFPVALMELKAQAPYHEPYRERFRELDAALRGGVEDAVDAGVEVGYFEAVDAAGIARAVSTMINGSHVRMVALGEDPEETRQVVEDYLDAQLGWSPEESA